MALDQTADPSPVSKSRSKPLSSKELLAHPAFESNDWTDRITPTSTGYASINNQSQRPGGPFKLYYELHGTGPTKLVFVMGLGAYRTAWKRQSKYFGHERGDQYTCLVYDNRGVGRSDKPTSRYNTREMAMDCLELLAYVGWLEKDTIEQLLSGFYQKPSKTTSTNMASDENRSLTIAGVSMGGMIAQEVALLIPQYIQSLILISTAPRLVRTVPFLENLRQRINMFIPRDVDVQLDEIAHRLFSSTFLEKPDHENNDQSQNFPTVQDRFAASELAKRMDKEGFTRKGFVLQAIAAGWHHKSAEQLQQIVKEVGGQRICVMHGTGDRMITYRHFELFKEEMGSDKGVDFRSWDGPGHVLMWEAEDEFNQAFEEVVKKNATH